MDPFDLKVMLGADYDGSLEKLEQICEAINRRAIRMAARMSGSGTAHHGYEDGPIAASVRGEPALGTRQWTRLRSN